MPNPNHTSDKPEGSTAANMSLLVAEVAKNLMGVSLLNMEAALDDIMFDISHNFAASSGHYRRHDIEKRQSIKVAEWPRRGSATNFDSPAQWKFTNNAPAQRLESLQTPYRVLPDDLEGTLVHSLFTETIPSQGAQAVVVPLLSISGVLGTLYFVRDSTIVWTDEELVCLQAIASLFMQTQSRLQAEQALREVAFFCPVTRLLNLPGLYEFANELAATESEAALVQIDLGVLRTVNEAMGRADGDTLLQQFADRMRSLKIPHSGVAHLSGNSFVVLLRDQAGSTAQLRKIIQFWESELSKGLNVGDRSVDPELKIGVARSLGRTVTLETLLTEANNAIVSRPPDAQSGVMLYDEKLADINAKRAEMELGLRDALNNDQQLEVYYQPEVDLITGKLTGCEALIRWHHPEKGFLEAHEFINMAENSGLVSPLSWKVLEIAISQQAVWMCEDPDLDTSMRVNISPKQLIGTDLAAEVKTLLEKYSLDASRLCLEVTEHVLMDSSEQALSNLDNLMEMGVEVAIDDFGVGHSSIAKLKHLPADTLKIDREFITSLVDTDRDIALVDTIIRMAKAFDMLVVAEGVETEAELTELLKLGADRAQGYLFAKPMPAEQVIHLFHKHLFEPSDYKTQKETVPLLQAV